MKTLRYPALAFLILVFVLGGCRSGCQSVTVAPEPAGNPAELLRESYVPWSYVELPVRFELRSPKKFSVSGTAKMTAGEAVLFSFRFFGMEMGSLWLTADSVQAIVKPMNVYYKGDLASLTSAAGMSMDDIQAILMGHIFEVTPQMPFEADFHASFDGSGVAMLDSVTVRPRGHKAVTVTYGAPETGSCGPFASSFGAATSVRGLDIDFNCRWDVERAKWNTAKVLAAPRVPSDMRQLSSDDLLKILKKL